MPGHARRVYWRDLPGLDGHRVEILVFRRKLQSRGSRQGTGRPGTTGLAHRRAARRIVQPPFHGELVAGRFRPAPLPQTRKRGHEGRGAGQDEIARFTRTRLPLLELPLPPSPLRPTRSHASRLVPGTCYNGLS